MADLLMGLMISPSSISHLAVVAFSEKVLQVFGRKFQIFIVTMSLCLLIQLERATIWTQL